MAAGSTSGGAWLRRRLSRRRRDGEETEDGASMSSRLREVIMGACWRLLFQQGFVHSNLILPAQTRLPWTDLCPSKTSPRHIPS